MSVTSSPTTTSTPQSPEKSHHRLQLLKGIVKAVFTTAPSTPSQVTATADGFRITSAQRSPE